MNISKTVKIIILCFVLIGVWQYYSKNLVLYSKVDLTDISQDTIEIFPSKWMIKWSYKKVIQRGEKTGSPYFESASPGSVDTFFFRTKGGSKINPIVIVKISYYAHNQSLLELPLRDFNIKRPIFKSFTCSCLYKLDYSYPRCLLSYPIGNYRAQLNMYFHNDRCEDGRVDSSLIDEVRNVGVKFDKLVYDYLQPYRIVSTS